MEATYRKRTRFADLSAAAEKIGKARERDRNHLASMVLMVALYVLIMPLVWSVYSNRYPLDLSRLWWQGKPLGEALLSTWPLMAWGAGISTLICMLVKRDVSDRIAACDIYKINLRVSLRAGIVEELIFRWSLLILAIPLVQLFNRFPFFGGLRWLHVEVLGPLADWATMHSLHEQLMGSPWYFGAAILAANARFRDGHKYQGVVGILNSWFIGMFMFWLTFSYGLLIAMLAHAVYDAIIASIHYLDAHWDNRREFDRW